MNRSIRSFDRLARCYRCLEWIAFGHDLDRARFCFLDRLCECREILILGEGDGRFLEQLVRVAPAARILCVDSSGAMLDRARARLAGEKAAGSIAWMQADALTCEWPAERRFDAVVTLFFLDCFSTEQVTTLVARIRPRLSPDSCWLFADFVLPARGWARLRARLWLAALYAFFRWQTGLKTRALPASEAILLQAGFGREALRDFQGGLVRSAVFARTTQRL